MRVRSGRPCSSSSACAAIAHREEERGDPPHHAVGVEVRREGGADRDVRQVPERVRRVQKRDVVAPAAPHERVPGGPYFSCVPMSRSRRRARAAWRARPRSLRRATPRGAAAAATPRSGPGSTGRGTSRPRASRAPISRPAPGSPARTHSSHGGRQTPRGTPNSSPAITPPGARRARARAASPPDPRRSEGGR